MKKFTLAILAIVLVFGLTFASCGGDDGNNNTPDNGNQPGGNQPGGNTPGTTYTIRYDINGGNGTPPQTQTATITEGTTGMDALGPKVTIDSGSGLSKSGYAMVCWNTKADGSGTNFQAGFEYQIGFVASLGGVTNTATLYAKWLKSEGGYLTINGIPSRHEGKYAFFRCEYPYPRLIYGFKEFVPEAYAWIEYYIGNYMLVQIANGSVRLPTWAASTSVKGCLERYSGNDSVSSCRLEIFSEDRPSANEIETRYFDNFTFSNGSAALDWKDGR